MSGNDDWVDWGGGECPVALDVMVEIWCRADSEHLVALHPLIEPAGNLYWTHHGSAGGDIIKYRVIREATQ